jgi:plasmid stabilization system protein ParE
MNRTLVVEPEAEVEIAEAAIWYDQQNPAARVSFFRAIDRALDAILENPQQYQIVYREARRALVDGYPYVLYYTASESQVIVISCFHTSRDPKTWRERLR